LALAINPRKATGKGCDRVGADDASAPSVSCSSAVMSAFKGASTKVS
jgi:hypothetical protein